MKRIRSENINTGEHFDQVFDSREEVYSSYPQIKIYNKLFNLKLFTEKTILDYGCGNAHSLSELATEYKILGTGVDISPSVVKKNKENFPGLEFYTVEEFKNNTKTVDVVVCTHTLEHTENPLEIAEKLLKTANKKLLIIVPYKESWNKCPEHLWEFDKNSFKQLSPTYVQVGIINQAGYVEIIYFWDKKDQRKKSFSQKISNTLRLLPYHSKKGVIKKLTSMLGREN